MSIWKLVWSPLPVFMAKRFKVNVHPKLAFLHFNFKRKLQFYGRRRNDDIDGERQGIEIVYLIGGYRRSLTSPPTLRSSRANSFSMRMNSDIACFMPKYVASVAVGSLWPKSAYPCSFIASNVMLFSTTLYLGAVSRNRWEGERERGNIKMVWSVLFICGEW